MISWIDIVSLIITTLQGASSAIKQIAQKHPGLSDRAQACYADALKEWVPNKGIRKQWETTLPTAAALTTYLTSNQTIDTEVNSLLKKWVDKLLVDEVCGAFILEARQVGLLSSIDRGIHEILATIKAPYNTLYTASSALRAYFSDIIPGYHIPRQETDILYNWLSTPADPEETQVDRIAVLLAGAGLGKTVILKDLQDKLEQEGTPVLGIKSDIIFDTSDITLDKALNLGAPAAEVIKQIALDQKTVILIDQIDALSAVLSADRRPLASITTFINEVSKYPGLLDIMLGIEGCISRRGSHASGVIFNDEDPFEYACYMRTPSGDIITCWDLHEAEAAGDTKYDFLVTEIQDKITQAIRLLQKYEHCDEDLTLKQWYEKHLHPDILPIEEEDVWKNIQNVEVLDLFQFDSQVGSQAAKKIKPSTLLELSDANGSTLALTHFTTNQWGH